MYYSYEWTDVPSLLIVNADGGVVSVPDMDLTGCCGLPERVRARLIQAKSRSVGRTRSVNPVRSVNRSVRSEDRASPRATLDIGSLEERRDFPEEDWPFSIRLGFSIANFVIIMSIDNLFDIMSIDNFVNFVIDSRPSIGKPTTVEIGKPTTVEIGQPRSRFSRGELALFD